MKPLANLALFASVATLAWTLPAAAQTGEAVLKETCASCHAVQKDGSIERIDAVRKTPEGWDMTVARMMRNHGVALTPDERAAVVRYLADTRGLSVAETEGWRYILEREPVATDTGPTQLMTETCGRCHSYARVALQRRTPEDWKHLINFHLGQFPTAEYQALARDRDWWGIAQNEIVPFLAKAYPLGDAPAVFTGDLSGLYVVAGHQPGRGDYSGTMTVTKAQDGYDTRLDLAFADGALTLKGPARLYGAGEWRATLTDDKIKIRQVMALKDGVLEGRWFGADDSVTGGRIVAVPKTAGPRIISVSPAAVKAGVPVEVTLTGAGLSGDPVLPEGMAAEVVRRSDTQVVLRVQASEPKAPAPVGLGTLVAPEKLVVYDKIDRLAIRPDVTISRIGGNGGPIPKTPAQFEAIGFLAGPDGKVGTEDDISIGPVAATWSFDNWNAAAAAAEDAAFAGQIDQTGRFTPADAGPNPKRQMSANNVGDLKVTATVAQKDGPVSGEAHLYATVQRFVDPPIR